MRFARERLRRVKRPPRVGAWVSGLTAFLVAATVINPAPTQAQGLSLIRDSEIEALLNDYARPIFKVAGLGAGRVAIRIIRNDAFNAFVVDGRNVFIHTGTLQQAQTPNEVIGVLAHETGHITGGHLAALRVRIAKDQTRALLTQILGIGLMVAGGVSGGDAGQDLLGAGQGVTGIGNEVIMRSLLAERRSQESAADQAGLKFLNETRQSGVGMLETFERFAQQEYISDTHKDPFVRTHPVATDRLARLRELVQSSPYFAGKDTADLQLRHNLMRAKLAGYIERPGLVLNRYPATDKSLPARYGRALARYFQGGPGALDGALAELDTLIRDRPQSPWFWEVKGDLLMRSGRNQDAIPMLRQALKLAPEANLVRVQLATALQGTNDPATAPEAVALLRKSLVEDLNPRAYRLLANAYYQQGKAPEADAAIAQAHFLEGNLKQAQIFAQRARVKLKPGTPEWVKNDDIINYQPPK